MKNLTLLFLLFSTVLTFGQTRTSVVSGDWSDPNTWTPTGVPQDGEEIFISTGHTITIDGTPDIALANVEITINGTLNMDNDGVNIGNLNLTGNSGLLVSSSGSIAESIPGWGEGFGGISLDGVTIWTACSNPTCVAIVNAILNPDPEVNGPVTGGTGGLLLPAVSNPLPVELIAFEARMVEGVVELNWQTLSELNNDRFEVEKSLDGYHFEQIGQVVGQGTTNEKQGYSFQDIHPFSGINYYRLKQIDFDGAFEYSTLVYAQNQNESILTKISFYPNPVKERLYIQSVNSVVFTNVELINMNGKEVAKLSVNGNEEILLPDLNSGPYILKYSTLSGHNGFTRILVE